MLKPYSWKKTNFYYFFPLYFFTLFFWIYSAVQKGIYWLVDSLLSQLDEYLLSYSHASLMHYRFSTKAGRTQDQKHMRAINVMRHVFNLYGFLSCLLKHYLISRNILYAVKSHNSNRLLYGTCPTFHYVSRWTKYPHPFNNYV